MGTEEKKSGQLEGAELRRAVREKYGSIAVEGGISTGCGCCDDSHQPGLFNMADYSGDELPAGADLGLGCGKPTELAALQPGEVVLDLGSGGGVDVFLAARMVGQEGHVIGVDMTPEMIELARRNAERDGVENVEFRLGEIEHLPVADGSVDVILSNCVINLVPDKRVAFAEMARVLRPDGRICISDIVTYGTVPEEVRESVAAYTGCVAGAVDRADYLALIEGAGLTGAEVLTERRLAPFDGAEWGALSVTVGARR